MSLTLSLSIIIVTLIMIVIIVTITNNNNKTVRIILSAHRWWMAVPFINLLKNDMTFTRKPNGRLIVLVVHAADMRDLYASAHTTIQHMIRQFRWHVAWINKCADAMTSPSFLSQMAHHPKSWVRNDFSKSKRLFVFNKLHGTIIIIIVILKNKNTSMSNTIFEF